MYMITLFIIKCLQFFVRFMVNGIKLGVKLIWYMAIAIRKLLFLFGVFVIGIIVTPFGKKN